MPTAINIAMSYQTVSPFIPIIQKQADKERDALGFLPASAYQELAYQNKVWVAVSSRTNECLGHLIFGGSFPSLKVFQTLVYPTGRGQGIARTLIETLVKYAEERYYLTITANVASELPANEFWERCGFLIIRQKPGGKSLGRTINVRIRQLKTPLLFGNDSSPTTRPTQAFDGIKYCGRTVESNTSYVLDLNVIFDVLKHRVHRDEAAMLLNAGMNGYVQIRITPEIEEELRRNSPELKPDPVLELARTMPTLPHVDENTLQPLLDILGPIIFPKRSTFASQTPQDKSDLRHLSIAIHHRMNGFITREKAILAAHDTLRKRFGLDILSPSDFAQPFCAAHTVKHKISAACGNNDIQIASGREEERNDIEMFMQTLGCSKDDLRTAWNPGATGNQRKRITIRSCGNLVGIASWDIPSIFVTTAHLFLHVCEDHPSAARIIDYVFDAMLRDFPRKGSYRISLPVKPQQPITRSAAMKRGFIPTSTNIFGADELVKAVWMETIDTLSWPEFAMQFRTITGLGLPKAMPSHEDFRLNGISISAAREQQPARLNLYDFETLISPSLVLCPGREAIILPIRAAFAEELFDGLNQQRGLFASREAILHSEKAYFKSPRGLSLFAVGRPVFFYVSGAKGGSKQVVGHGRITTSEILSIADADRRRSKQGVLTFDGMKNLSNKSGNILVITFDNFCRLPNPIPYTLLRKEHLVSKANLITAETLPSKAFERICTLGYKGLHE